MKHPYRSHDVEATAYVKFRVEMIVHRGSKGKIRAPCEAPSNMSNVCIGAPESSHLHGQLKSASKRATQAPNRSGLDIPKGFSCLIGLD